MYTDQATEGLRGAHCDRQRTLHRACEDAPSALRKRKSKARLKMGGGRMAVHAVERRDNEPADTDQAVR